MTITQCPKCGATLSESDAFCSTCGSQVGAFTEQSTPTIQPVKNTEKNNQKTKKIAFIAIVAIILCSLSLFAIKYFGDMEKENAARVKDTYLKGVLLYVTIPPVSNPDLIFEFHWLTYDVWYNAIYEKTDAETDPYTRPDGYWVNDFNEAVKNLYAAPSTINLFVELENLLAEFEMFMNEYKNPPEGLEQFSDLLLNLNTSYKASVEFAINPTGNLAEFKEKTNSLHTDYFDAWRKILVEIERIQQSTK